MSPRCLIPSGVFLAAIGRPPSSIQNSSPRSRCFAFFTLSCTDIVRPFLSEPLEVELFNVLRQGDLPRLVPVIGHASQLLGVHSKFSRHLHLGMGKVEPLASIDPRLEFRRELLPLAHIVTLHTTRGLLGLLLISAGQLLQPGLDLSLAQMANCGNLCHLRLSRPRGLLFPTVDGLAGDADELAVIGRR